MLLSVFLCKIYCILGWFRRPPHINIYEMKTFKQYYLKETRGFSGETLDPRYRYRKGHRHAGQPNEKAYNKDAAALNAEIQRALRNIQPDQNIEQTREELMQMLQKIDAQYKAAGGETFAAKKDLIDRRRELQAAQTTGEAVELIQDLADSLLG